MTTDASHCAKYKYSDVSWWPLWLNGKIFILNNSIRLSIKFYNSFSNSLNSLLSIFVESSIILPPNYIINFVDPDHRSRVFRDKKENAKVIDGKLRDISVKTKSQCAMHCFLDNSCTQFSYHGDAFSNNCLLGSATSGQENQDSWTTFLTWHSSENYVATFNITWRAGA